MGVVWAINPTKESNMGMTWAIKPHQGVQYGRGMSY